MGEEEFKALCESMSLTELGEMLRSGFEVLYNKLYKDEGFGSEMMMMGNLSSSWPDIIIVEVPEGNPGTSYREIFRL